MTRKRADKIPRVQSREWVTRLRNAWANRCLRCLIDPFHR